MKLYKYVAVPETLNKELLYTVCDVCDNSIPAFKYYGVGRFSQASLTKKVTERHDDGKVVVMTVDYDLCEKCFDKLDWEFATSGMRPTVIEKEY